MKVNLDKLSELETKYKESRLTTDAIQKMLITVLEKTLVVNGSYIDPKTESYYVLSHTTLTDLGVIEN